MNKDLIRSKNTNPPAVVFQSVNKPREVWKNKAQVQWVQPKNQRLTLQWLSSADIKFKYLVKDAGGYVNNLKLLITQIHSIFFHLTFNLPLWE